MLDVHAGLFQWVQAHGIVGIFVFMVVENLAVPFPTELAFLAAQGLVSGGYIPYWVVFVVITGGQLVGSAVTYYAGRAGENWLVRRFGHSRAMMRVRDKLQRWYGKYGAVAVLFGRLVGQIRPWSSLAAGMGGVPQGKFWFWTTIGASVYSVAAMYFTKVGWELLVAHPQLRIPAIIGVIVVFYGAAGAGVTVKWWRRHQRLKAARLAEAEAQPEAGPESKEKEAA